MAVPQRTLNWLYNVLAKDHYDPQQTYHDPNRAYHDVANALAQYPSLSPRTDVYTYETGFSALLVHLVGTLPVAFRGTTYQFPLALWIPNTYPHEPPIVFVTPTQDMAVRVGQHVTLEGRVYHHYLAHWAEGWDRSSIIDLLTILREVFAKEPPVRYRQQMPPQPQLQQNPVPPPLPPLPPGVGSSTASPQMSHSHPAGQIPPQRPPKPRSTVEPRQLPQPHPAERYQSPPPLPPLPPKEQNPRQMPPSSHGPVASPGNRASQHYVSPHGSISSPRPLSQPPVPQPAWQSMSPQFHQGLASYQQNRGDQATSVLGPSIPRPLPHQTGPPGPPPVQPAQQWPTQALSHDSSRPGCQSHLPQHQEPSGPPYPQHSPYPSNYPRPPPAAPPRQAETPDLLTSPFELELPSFAPVGPAPPIPPNPEKDALLHTVSQSLGETLRAHATQSDIAAQSLVSQSRSLHAALATLQGEVTAINALHATLQLNTAVLQQSIHRADATINDAQARSASVSTSGAPSTSTTAIPSDHPSGLPPIDDVLVAPTVVGKQLYDLVAEEQGLQQALYALQAALVRGVTGVDSWSRHTRGLAREAFFKRALIRKIGRGMGLEENVQ